MIQKNYDLKARLDASIASGAESHNAMTKGILLEVVTPAKYLCDRSLDDLNWPAECSEESGSLVWEW